jgi:hypothetical protein
MATLMPVATACRYHGRGSNDGLIDHAKNNKANVNPTGWHERANPMVRARGGSRSHLPLVQEIGVAIQRKYQRRM